MTISKDCKKSDQKPKIVMALDTGLPIHVDGKKHLPQPRGPHSVGFVDINTPGKEAGVLVRMYYPTKEQCLDKADRWPLWADDHYISGLLTFIKAMNHRWPSWAPRGEYLYFDQVRHLTTLIPMTGFPTIFRMLNGKVFTPIIENASLNTDQKWPVVVFSHGLGCARFTYSQICYDIASHGFVVIAPEHRDGSGCSSFWKEKEAPRAFIPHRRVHHDENEYEVRNSQVHTRASEASKALDLAFNINAGNAIENTIPLSYDYEAPDLTVFKNAFDLERPVMTGHSFGGATTLLTLGKDSRFAAGIALDAWLFPIRDENDLDSKVTQSVMFINTESFLNEDNLRKMETFANSTENEHAERVCHYIRGSVHQNHIDAPFVMRGSKIKHLLGMHSTTCPDMVMSLNNKMMVQFLRSVLQLEKDAEIDSEVDKLKNLLHSGFGTECLETANR